MQIYKFYCSIKINTKTELLLDELDKTLNNRNLQIKYCIMAWEKFDKIPYKERTYFKRLENNVIIPLRLQLTLKHCKQ
jgi:hypothetical protein